MGAMWVVILWLGTAHAGNDRGNAYGAEAATTAGALVATTREAEATWYNPAGLGGTERTRLSVNLSAFVMRIREHDAFVTTRVGDDELRTPGSATQLVSVPSSITLVRRVSPRTSFGLGVYVTRADRINVLSSAQQDLNDPWDVAVYTQSFQVLSEVQQYHAGISIGTEVSDRVRLGGSVFGVYDRVITSESFVSHLTGSRDGVDQLQTFETNASATFNALGIRAVGSLQWQMTNHWSLGLVVRTPVLGFYRWGKFAITEVQNVEPAGGGLEDAFSYADGDLDETRAVQVDPMRVSLAFGVVYPRFTFGLEGEVAFGVVLDTSGSARRVHGNATLGGRFAVTERLWLGAGLFTDLSPTANVGLLASRLDFYGLTFGPEVRTPVRARGRDDGIVFSTTVGVRYAVGTGPFGTVLFEPRKPVAGGVVPALQTLPQRVAFHEISLLLGSSVAF